MKVVYIAAGQEPEVKEIGGSLKGMQKLVGGYIETIHPFNDTAVIVCNEEGKINGQSGKGRKQILIDDLSLVFLSSLFCNIKHISWSYENEFRCTTGATAKGMPYVSAVPKEIYIGMNCMQSYEDRIIRIANKLQIPVYKMKFNERSSEFNLIAKKL